MQDLDCFLICLSNSRQDMPLDVKLRFQDSGAGRKFPSLVTGLDFRLGCQVWMSGLDLRIQV